MFLASSFSRAALTLAVCAAAMSAAAPAAAGEPREIRISVDRLDLTAPDDAAVLNARVVQAARAVCRRPNHAVETVLSQSACVADTVRRARAQIEQAEALEQADAARISGLRAR